MGRILSGGGRPAWHDRNPIHRLNAYDASSVAPHTANNRWAYTVPTGKKAFVEYMCVTVRRDGAPTTAGLVMAYISVQPSGGSETTIAYAIHLNATVGTFDKTLVGASIMLFPGDVLRGYTIDLSTGGTMALNVSAKLTEFDA